MEEWKSYINPAQIEWLLDSNPWTKYKTLTDLLELDNSDSESIKAKCQLISDNKVVELANDTRNWLSVAATRNSDPKISYYKLRMLADFGLTYKDLHLPETVEKASAHIIENMFAVRGRLPERPKKGEKFVKPDLTEDVWHISPCNSPVITYCLLKLGVQDEQVLNSIDELCFRWNKDEGWFCHLFFVESMFKKLHVGCPMAAMQALEVFSLVPELKNSEVVKNAFKPIEFHYSSGKSLYYFGRSKKFRTLKYPYVWYNALYMADVLTRFPVFKDRPLVKELIDWIIDSQDPEGKYKPTSIFMNYKGWDFSNKKEPSPWLTFLCYRILKRYYQ